MKTFKFIAITSVLFLIGSGCKTAKPVQNVLVNKPCEGSFAEKNGPIDINKAIRVAVVDSKTGKGIRAPIAIQETEQFFSTDETGCVDLPPTTTQFLIPALFEFEGMKLVMIPVPANNEIITVKLDPIDPTAPIVEKEPEKIYAKTEDFQIPDQFCEVGPFGGSPEPLSKINIFRIAVLDSKTGSTVGTPIVVQPRVEIYGTNSNGVCADLPPTTTKFLIPENHDYFGYKWVTIPTTSTKEIIYVKLDPIPQQPYKIATATTTISSLPENLNEKYSRFTGSIIQGTVKKNGLPQPKAKIIFSEGLTFDGYNYGPTIKTDENGKFKTLIHFPTGKHLIYFPNLDDRVFEIDWVEGRIVNVNFNL